MGTVPHETLPARRSVPPSDEGGGAIARPEKAPLWTILGRQEAGIDVVKVDSQRGVATLRHVLRTRFFLGKSARGELAHEQGSIHLPVKSKEQKKCTVNKDRPY